MTHCNWFWGSHGCDLPMWHSGDHLCGTEDDPCSKHNGTQVQFHYIGGDWSGEWDDLPGFCNPGQCGDPEHCSYRDEPWHNEPRRDFGYELIEDHRSDVPQE